MGYIDDISKLNVMRDDIVAKDAATQRLLGLVATYGGDQSLAQAVIDADAAIQQLVFTAIASTVGNLTVTPVALPDTLAALKPTVIS